MSTTTMAKRATGVYRRPDSNVWQWRIKVPKDLAHLYPAKECAVRRTLGTTDLAEANRLAARLYADWLAKFEQQRKQQNPQPVALTPELRQFLAESFHHSVLDRNQKTRTGGGLAKGGLSREEFEEAADSHMFVRSFYGEAMATGDIGVAHPHLEDEAKKLGIAISENMPGYTEALTAMLVAVRESIDTVIDRDRGKVAPTPPAPTLKKPEKVYYLRDIFDKWKEADGPNVTADSVRAREIALELFEKFTNNTPIAKVTRLQGNDFKAWIQTRGEASKTVSDRLTYVKALMQYAYCELELIPRHPWHGITLDHETETKRKPWTTSQIKAFFAQPLYTSYALPRLQKGAGADAGYWIPLMGLFSGARSSELCQLHVADVVEVEGFWVIDINEDAEGKTVKTKGSRRLVPLHSELIRLGFLDYVEATRKAGHERLWPKLTLRTERPSHVFSNWFNKKPRMANPEVAIPDFHSLRHTARTAMKATPEHHKDAVTGHEIKGSVGTTTYTHPTPDEVRAAVETIRYEGFDLQRSYKPQ